VRNFLGFLFFVTATLATFPVFVWDIAVWPPKRKKKQYHTFFPRTCEWILKTARKIDGGR
jgi:hypothetical protein